MFHIRLACLFSPVAAVHYVGPINPLYQNQQDGPETRASMEEHMKLMQDYVPVNTLRRNRQRFLVGTTDCNSTIGISDYREHAAALQEHDFALTKSFLSFGAGGALDSTWGYATALPEQFSPLLSQLREVQLSDAEEAGVPFAWKATGVFFEKNTRNCELIKQRLGKSKSSMVICEEVTPMNVIRLLEQHVPSVAKGVRHFDLIKIDLGSYDSLLVRALARHHVTAKHWQLGVNPAIPPPYQLAVYYHPRLDEASRNASRSDTTLDNEDVVPRDWGLFGVSLSAAVHLMKDINCELVTFKENQALFVHHNYKQIYGFQPPFDEFDCYHKAVVAVDGLSVQQTRKWFYESPVEQGNAEIFQALIKHSLPATGGKFAFPFELKY